jgi:hypothetical protein
MNTADESIDACDSFRTVLVHCWVSGVRLDIVDAGGAEDTAYVPRIGNTWGGGAGVGWGMNFRGRKMKLDPFGRDYKSAQVTYAADVK